ncbi:MAG: hypothetical protein ABIR10_16975 [Dokdonella sp.]
MDIDDNASAQDLRHTLLKDIRAAHGRPLSLAMEAGLELASNDDLRLCLLISNAFAEQLSIAPCRNADYLDHEPSTDGRRESALSGRPADWPWQMISSSPGARHEITSTGYAVRHPEHRFVYARQILSDYKGPEWVPLNLFSALDTDKETSECARKLIEDPGARELWDAIGSTYRGAGDADAMASAIPRRCAEYLRKWRALPKVSPSEHRAARENLGRNAAQLAIELDRYLTVVDSEDGEGLDFMRVMSQSERTETHEAVKRYCHRAHNRALTEAGARRVDYADYVLPQDSAAPPSPLNHMRCIDDVGAAWALIDEIVPNLPSLLKRMAKLFADDAPKAPLARPNLRNAAPNFFARRLCEYFWLECGDVSPSIVARIVSIFHDQAIGENNVSQMIAQVKAENPLPDPP